MALMWTLYYSIPKTKEEGYLEDRIWNIIDKAVQQNKVLHQSLEYNDILIIPDNSQFFGRACNR